MSSCVSLSSSWRPSSWKAPQTTTTSRKSWRATTEKVTLRLACQAIRQPARKIATGVSTLAPDRLRDDLGRDRNAEDQGQAECQPPDGECVPRFGQLEHLL